MIVDDSAVVRGLISKMISNDPNVAVADTVANGLLAVKRVGRGDVDIVVLDIEMPVLDGLTALPQILAKAPNIKVIMASTLTMKNAEISLKALEAGAADYITKPSSSREMTGGKDFQHELLEKIKNLAPGKVHLAPRPERWPIRRLFQALRLSCARGRHCARSRTFSWSAHLLAARKRCLHSSRA